MMLSCKEAARLLSERLDKQLTPGARLALMAHLAICRGCRAMNQRFAFLRRALKSASSHDDTGR